jgi:L-fuculose-phosphate aldolase
VLDDYKDLIEELAEAGRDSVERGLVLASGGNLSARHPSADTFVVTGTGAYLDRLDADAFAVMDLDGDVVGGRPRPSSEWKLHQRTYRMRPDVNSVIHLHPQMAVLLDALGHEVRLITLDHAYYLRKIRRCPYAPNGSDEMGDWAAEASRDCDVIILEYHGCSTLGDSIGMAYRRALSLEEAAQNTYRCLLLGNADLTFPADEMARIHHA